MVDMCFWSEGGIALVDAKAMRVPDGRNARIYAALPKADPSSRQFFDSSDLSAGHVRRFILSRLLVEKGCPI